MSLSSIYRYIDLVFELRSIYFDVKKLKKSDRRNELRAAVKALGASILSDLLAKVERFKAQLAEIRKAESAGSNPDEVVPPMAE